MNPIDFEFSKFARFFIKIFKFFFFQKKIFFYIFLDRISKLHSIIVLSIKIDFFLVKYVVKVKGQGHGSIKVRKFQCTVTTSIFIVGTPNKDQNVRLDEF